jgi:hypothetical protein
VLRALAPGRARVGGAGSPEAQPLWTLQRWEYTQR